MKIQDSRTAEMPMPAANPKEPADLGALFDGHIEKEFADLDVDATMETMVAEPLCVLCSCHDRRLRGPRRPPLLQ